MKVLDETGFIELVASCASDLAVVNAARVSFNASSTEMTKKDIGLINFLMRNRHGTPFEHGFFSFRVRAPIFVAREWFRHRIGHACAEEHSFNEQSGRYSEYGPEFYLPTHGRRQTGKVGEYTFEDYELLPGEIELMKHEYHAAMAAYKTLMRGGMARELSRIMLPIALYTSFIWSCNPRSLMHFLSLRTGTQALWEIRQYATVAESIFADLMPITYEAFQSNGLRAP